MTAFFDVNLKKISQVVKRWTGVAELTLLLNGSRLSIALRDDDASQRITKFAGHFLICRRAVVVTETNFRVRFSGFKEDAPAIVRHLHVIKMRPAFATDV